MTGVTPSDCACFCAYFCGERCEAAHSRHSMNLDFSRICISCFARLCASTGLKIPRPSLGMWVRPPPPAPQLKASPKLIRLVAFIPHRANKYGERCKGVRHDEAYPARGAGPLQCRGYELLQRDMRLLQLRARQSAGRQPALD